MLNTAATRVSRSVLWVFKDCFATAFLQLASLKLLKPVFPAVFCEFSKLVLLQLFVGLHSRSLLKPLFPAVFREFSKLALPQLF